MTNRTINNFGFFCSICNSHDHKETAHRESPFLKCKQCCLMLPIENFYTSTNRHGKRRGRGLCKRCLHKAEKIKRDTSWEDRIYRIYYNCLGRSKKDNRPVDITHKYLLELIKKQEYKCYYSHVDLLLEPNLNNTVSLDRVDSNKGYLMDNVVFCAWVINDMKKNIHIDRFLDLCGKIVDNIDTKTKQII